jgi:hypothetical protein
MITLNAEVAVNDVQMQGKDEAGKPTNDWWKPSLALLNEKDFLNRLKSYDKDNIPPRIVATIRNTYLTDATFTPENAKRASPAAEGMCKWVHAMSSYDKVAKVVAPKKAKLAEAEAQYQEVMVGLTAKQAELQVRPGSRCLPIQEVSVKQGILHILDFFGIFSLPVTQSFMDTADNINGLLTLIVLVVAFRAC